MTKIAAIVVAAGRGTRVVGARTPKQYIDIAGQMLLTRTLAPLLANPRIDRVHVVIHADNAALYEAAVAGLASSDLAKLDPPAIGGATRQQSVEAGLRALAADPPDLVLIHDAARPFVTAANLDALIAAASEHRAAILASPLADTLKKASAERAVIDTTIPRENLWRAETPQAFRYTEIREAHAAAFRSGRSDFTDDASIAEWAGMKVALVDSGGGNTKITTAEDVAMAVQRFAAAASPMETCVGQGFDVHRFTDGDHVWICGVKIAHTHGVEAHSDGDVALHALTDALLGTIGDGDIGIHFKNTDPRWRSASSDQFLLDARRRVEERGGKIRHVDVTILAEAPKIGPHRDAMIARLAALLDLPAHRIGLKATTTERMGFTGRREGLAAMATATVSLPATE